ncbi:salt stress protein, Slr1339 family [Microcoleus sp. herbarium2]|uniref:salt stress protein, Slr1339 family n=1 Tax=Microcoleus sp. herbarium2 TaxID=3055433 RepID=UPI002FD0D024
MESIDRLLAELKAEYQASRKQADDLKSQPLVQAQAPLKPAAVPSNPTFKTSEINLYAGALDKDLAQIKAEYEAQNKAQEVASLEPLKAEYKAQNKVQEVASLEPQPAAEKVAAPQLDVETHRQKVRQAQVWLKKLDKNSDEGYWFDQFAFKYSSRIDAAIDYLQAVNEFD